MQAVEPRTLIDENEFMCKHLQRKPILTDQAIKELRRAKLEIIDAVLDKVPERLVLTTARAAVKLARCRARPQEVLSERVVHLVRATLKDLAQKTWKPETALLLKKRLCEPRKLSND
jgi:hypothetical protein